MAAMPPGTDGSASPRVDVAGVVQGEDPFDDAGCRAREGAGCGSAHGVADGAELEGNEVVESVAAVRGGGQAEPAPSRDVPDGVLERRGGDVVALVDDDQAVAGGERGQVVAAGRGSAA